MEKSYVYLIAVSFMILLICLLAGFYLGIKNLEAIGTIYGFLLSAPIFLTQKTESDRNILVGVAIGLPTIIILAVITSVFTKNLQIIGVLQITEWSVEEAAKYPLTLKLGALAFTLGISPSTLLSLLVNIPGPVAEESFFRIFLINVLTPIMGRWKTLIAQAIGFGVVHFLAYHLDVSGIITATICGLALGFMYVKTESETAICLTHMLFNWIIVLMSGGQ